MLDRGDVSAEELHARLRRTRRRRARVPATARLRRRRGDPDRAQGRDRDEGRRDDRRLEDPRGLRPRLRLDRRVARQGREALAPRQDEHGRVRDGLVHRELRLRSLAQPVGSDARPRRLGRRLGRGGGGRARAVGARLRHGRLDQAARVALRDRRPATDLRHRLALRRRRVRIVARPGRADREDGPRRGTALLDHRRTRPVRLDDRRRAAGRAADRGGPARRPRRRPEGAERGGGHRARRLAKPCAARSTSARTRRRGRGVLAAALGRVRPRVLLPDRSRRGVVEPLALRRRALRLPRRRRRRRHHRLYERTRDEGFGDEPKRRILLGTYALSAGYYDAYYGQAQKVRTIIIREHAALFERFDVLVSPTSPTVAFKLGEKAAARSRCISPTCSRFRRTWRACRA